MLVSAVAYSQGVIGKWVTEGGDSQVEIYQNGDQLCGKIIWLKKGDGQLDTHNPDKSMRSRKLLGVNILTGLKKKGDKYEGGKIYNPKNGKTYKAAGAGEDPQGHARYGDCDALRRSALTRLHGLLWCRWWSESSLRPRLNKTGRYVSHQNLLHLIPALFRIKCSKFWN